MTLFEEHWRWGLEQTGMHERVRILYLPFVRVSLGYYRVEHEYDPRPRLLVKIGWLYGRHFPLCPPPPVAFSAWIARRRSGKS